MKNLVSIVTTLYNYKQYIADLIDSVLQQSYPNWELIIVDDASTDSSFEVIEPHLVDKRISYIRFDENKGYSVAKNEGVIKARGEYIVMVDADDMLTPNSIEDRRNALEKAPGSLWCHGGVLTLQADGSLSKESNLRRKNLRKKLSQEIDLDREYHHRLIHAQSVMVKRELHEKIGLYDELLRFSSDNEMWRRIIRFGHIPIYVDGFVAIYRVHDARMSRSKNKKKSIESVKKYIIAMVEQRFEEGITENNTRLLK